MFLAYKKSDNNVTACRGTEWQCRMTAKGIDLTAYNTWVATITDGDGVVTYPSENFTIVECTDEDVSARLNQLGDYVNSNRNVGEPRVYNIKWSDSKVSAVIGQDMAGKDITIQTHFTGDDTARDARLLVSKWDLIRIDRNNRLAETDYLALKDSTLTSNMKTYRQALRDVPSQSDPDNITWPTKP